jgi:hypothetical protein
MYLLLSLMAEVLKVVPGEHHLTRGATTWPEFPTLSSRRQKTDRVFEDGDDKHQVLKFRTPSYPPTVRHSI